MSPLFNRYYKYSIGTYMYVFAFWIQCYDCDDCVHTSKFRCFVLEKFDGGGSVGVALLLDCCVPGGMCVCVEDAVAPVLCLFPQGWAAAVAAAGGGVLQVGRADSLTHVDPCPYSRAPPLSLTCPNNSSVSDGLPSLQSDWTTAKTRPQTCYFRYVFYKTIIIGY